MLFVAACAGGTPPTHPHPHARPAGAPPGSEGHAFHHRFDGAAGWSKVFDDPARDAWQKPGEVVALLDVAPGMTVADVGAGTGYFVPHLARAVGPAGRVHALDVEEEMVTWLRARVERDHLTNVTATRAAPDDPGLAPGSVHRALVVDTWHHIGDRGRYAARLHDALAPGGLVAVVDFTADAPMGPPAAHRLSPEQVIAELRAGGLEASLVEESLPHQFVVVGKRR